jgi:GT2 family glycosyltransferase
MVISFLMPVIPTSGVGAVDFNDAITFLQQSVQSLIHQTIPNWELILVANERKFSRVEKLMDEISNSNFKNLKQISIKIISIHSSNHAEALNAATKLARGQYICAMNLGDQLSKHAVFELLFHIHRNPNCALVYSDSDFIDKFGRRNTPKFKPNFSPDLLYSKNYIGNLSCIKKNTLKRIGGWSTKFKHAYDYDFFLKLSHLALQKPNEIVISHINKVLYHERFINTQSTKKVSNKSIAQKQSHQQFLSLKNHLATMDHKVVVKCIGEKLFRIKWIAPSPIPMASLIIPTRDGGETLKRCLSSIINKTIYTNYEIIIIDNQSSCPKTLKILAKFNSDFPNIRLVKYDKPFNYSAINNHAAHLAQGEFLAFINDDTEVISPFWLNDMVGTSSRREVGCVGALLYYPDKTIQHAGVVVGMHGVADHAFKGLKKTKRNDYLDYLKVSRNPLAVTAAVMVVKKKLFLSVNGFDEINFKIAFNDVDLCLKIFHKGYFNVVLSHVELIHYESKTRIKYDQINNLDEINYFKKKYQRYSLIKEQNLPFGLHGKV